MPASKQHKDALHIKSGHYLLQTEADTVQLAANLAKQVTPGDIIYLVGDLGVGKTFFSQAFIKQLQYFGKVLSPTYSLVQSYPVLIKDQNLAHEIKLQLHHFDLYRLAEPLELEYIGIRDYLNKSDICLFEWPSKGKGVLPAPTIELTLTYHEEAAASRNAHLVLH